MIQLKKNNISRRDFLKGSAVGILGLASAGLLSGCDSNASESEKTSEATDNTAITKTSENTVTSENIETTVAAEDSITWDYEADVVVIGAGGAGLPAALKAMEDGASVILVESNFDCGGHASVSAGNLHFGGGTEIQKRYDIEDSADLYYYDHTVGTPLGARYNDRDYVRAVADNMVPCYDMCMANGLLELDEAPIVRNFWAEGEGGTEVESVPRQTNADMVTEGWVNDYTGTSSAGIGVTRPLEKSLREQGARFLMNYHMDKIYREDGLTGRVLGIMATYTPHIMPDETEPLSGLWSDGNIESVQETVNVKAKKGVIIATGGSTGNETFRTMIDPRLGPEFDGLAGMPFSDQDASGELAAMDIGAALGVMAGYAPDDGGWITTPSRFGSRYGYGGGFSTDSKVWKLVKARGISTDFESSVIVNMLGQRCGNEDLYNTNKYKNDRFDYFKTALASVVVDPDGDGNAHRLGGPLWAIFDQDAVIRNDWDMTQGVVDYDNGYCFKGETLTELAENVINKYYESIKMDPAILVKTIIDYNTYVDEGVDLEWGKETLNYKIQNGPFYAAWAMPILHDTLAGLRVNSDMQCVDTRGNVIPGLFCCGESSGGMRVHGLGRVMVSGYIAGRSAASIDADGNTTKHSLNEDEVIENELTEYEGDLEENLGGSSDGGTTGEGVQTYTGTSDNGLKGAVQLQITVEDGKITAIEILKHSETEEIGGVAFDTLIEEALASQSADIDVVSGATVTSEAFIEALAKAIEKAGL